MNMYRESLRLILTTNFSNNRIAQLVSRAPNTIKKYRWMAMKRKLDWNQVKAFNDVQVKAVLMKQPAEFPRKRLPDWLYEVV